MSSPVASASSADSIASAAVLFYAAIEAASLESCSGSAHAENVAKKTSGIVIKIAFAILFCFIPYLEFVMSLVNSRL